jgi:hypothetical protein
VGDDAADPAGSDDEDFVHNLKNEAQALGESGVAGKKLFQTRDVCLSRTTSPPFWYYRIPALSAARSGPGSYEEGITH